MILQNIQQQTTVILPSYNEEDNIWEIIQQIQSEYPDIHICVVNDGSTDATSKKVSKYPAVICIENSENRGLISAVSQGIMNVQTPYCIVMDADFQHPVEYIQTFLQNLSESPETCMIIAQRNNIFLRKFWYRVLISRGGIFLCNLRLCNFFIRDPLSGFFWGKSEFLKQKVSHIVSDGRWYKILFEILKKTDIKNTKITTFFYTFQNRKYGYSKINMQIYMLFLISLFR